MGLYEKMNEIDIIEPVVGLLGETGGFRLHGDGKIRALLAPSIFHDGPWLNVKVSPERNCFLWHHIYFKYYGIIHSKCFNCWKIAIKPKSLKDLMSLAKLELELMLPSKCGIERREYASHKGEYSAFFYAPITGKLEDAQRLCEDLKTKIYKVLPIDTPVILKRGCTEFENRFGPSNLWNYPQEQDGFEEMLDAAWEVPALIYPEPTVIVPYIFKKWIRWGLSHGDPTAKAYYDQLENFGITKTVRYDAGKVDVTSVPPIYREKKDDREPNGKKENEERGLLEGLPQD